MSVSKKTQCHFPSAKIKKIIQQNQQIGKLCNTIPFLVQKSLEIFLNDVLDNVQVLIKNKDVSKLTPPILKKALQASKYDFIKDSLVDVQDMQVGIKKRKSRANIQEDSQKLHQGGKKKRKSNITQ